MCKLESWAADEERSVLEIEDAWMVDDVMIEYDQNINHNLQNFKE